MGPAGAGHRSSQGDLTTGRARAPGGGQPLEAAAVAAVPLFRGLNQAALDVLARQGELRHFRSGQILFRAGSGAAALYVVLEGTVRVVRRTSGRGQVVHTEGVGGTLGEIPVFLKAPYPATAAATEPTRCVMLTPDAVMAAIGADPALAQRLLASLARRVRGLIERMDRLASSSVRARLAAWIAERAARSLGPVVSLGVTQAALAEELGTVREVIVKELAAMRRLGLLRAHGGGRVVVLDAAGLALLAGGQPAVSARGPSSPRPGQARGGAARGARPRSAGR